MSLTPPYALDACPPLVDRVGKTGILRVMLAPRDGRTIVADQYWRVPLQALPPAYQDHDDEAWLYLLNPTGGLVQGDRLRTELTLAAGARAVVSTQSATKVYRMEDSCAEESSRYVLHGDAVLEYVPDQTIPFAGARLHRRTLIEADPDATWIVTDALAAGRIARGERFAFDHLVVDVDMRVGETWLLDRCRLSPSEDRLDRAGVWQGYSYYGSLYAYAPRLDRPLADTVADLIERRAGVYGGAGQPRPGFLVARILADAAWRLQDVLFDAWNVLRGALVGKPARHPRKL